MARQPARNDAATEVIDVEAEVVDLQTAAPAAAWGPWSALVGEAGTAWWRLQADAWQQQWAWWTALMQGRLPLNVALDIAEAEAEHAANPLAASPLWMPAQEAARQTMSLVVAPWAQWFGWTPPASAPAGRPAR